MAKHRFDASVLREYDIRGTVGETLKEADAYAVGRAFGTMVDWEGGRTVALGCDGRLSSPMLEAAVAKGLADCGHRVKRIGLGPTPMLYFAVYHLDADAGIMVTGSHNPPDFNGFKMMLGKKPFFGAQIQEIGRIAAEGRYAAGAGTTEAVALQDAYVARLLQDYDGTRPLKVAWDAGNGATGDALQALVKKLPGKHILLNERIDGTFPAHHPDPTVPKNLVQLQEAVQKQKCDFGIAFDGDGDRIGVIDERGRILWGDQLVALLSRDVLARQPGATIIADVKASQVLFDEIARLGGKPLMWKTGHSLIKSKMAETKSPLAGEMSGHIFFADRYYGYDDALYVAVRFLGLAARSTVSVGVMRDSLPQMVNTPELRFDCAEARKFAVIDEVRARLERAGAKVDGTDGVRVSTRDGWWLLRASNTQAVLVARCEARDPAGLERLKAALTAEVTASGITPPAI
ncbi:MAG TPA: phosphomannomutase/phosphoglucomutase [Candidatus Sulfotelmatobacter sp.]|nr:phosphomannomutase/phosphoglucomutase [Candidatus Sulfotelmatobacter sp.]